VTVDVVILFVYTLVEGVRGNLEATRTVHAERPNQHSEKQSEQFQEAVRQLSEGHKVYTVYCTIIVGALT